MPLKVAVIGCGPIGNRHADIYKEDSLANLVAVCDLRHDRLDASAARLGVKGYDNAMEMLATEKPDLVSVATGGIEYGSDHYLPTMLALEAGCHVLCEKPICNTIPEARKMVDCARRNRRCFGIDFNHRFTEAAKVAKKWVDDGRIGQQLFINMAMWIKNPNESSPFFMIKALNPHSIDVIRHFAGDIAAVQAFCTKAEGRTIWTTMSLNLKFRSGAVGHLSASYDIQRGHPMERCEVAGLKGRFVLEDMWREATLYEAGNPIKEVYTNPVFGGHRDFVDTFRNRIHKFLEQVTQGVAPEEIDGSGLDGLKAQTVLQCAIDSLQNETIVQVPEIY